MCRAAAEIIPSQCIQQHALMQIKVRLLFRVEQLIAPRVISLTIRAHVRSIIGTGRTAAGTCVTCRGCQEELVEIKIIEHLCKKG